MMRAVFLISKIHLLRNLRMINQLGIFRVLFLITILSYTIKATTRPGMLVWQAFLLLSLVMQIHFSRKDYVLLNNLGLNKQAYFILLYGLFVSPFLILYLLWPDYSAFIVLLSGIVLTSLFIRPPVNFRKIRIPAFRFIPAGLWEWRVGLRQYLPVLLLAYIIPAVFYQQDYIFAASVLLIAVTTNALHLYHEPLNMLAALQKSPAAYFWYKVKFQCLFFTFLSLPLLTASFLLYPEGIRPVLLLFFNSLIVQVFAVAVKYAGYLPGYKSPYNMAISFLLNFSFVIPAMLPVPVVMAVIFSRKALIQLKRTTG